MTTNEPWRLVAAWLASLAVTAALTATGTTYAILAHGDVLGAPLMLLGAKFAGAGEPAIITAYDPILAPLPGELDTPMPMPTPAARRAASRKDAGTKLARR